MTIPTREMVLMAGNIVGIVRRYGTEDIDSEERIQSAQLFFKDKFQNVWYKL